ncbi:MAG TPA: uroporphyrinogen-III synthase [Acidimicrobiales bacterium]|nr:uroporphyrinogen-III synthase [Acidimicrobiales bacterium]
MTVSYLASGSPDPSTLTLAAVERLRVADVVVVAHVGLGAPHAPRADLVDLSGLGRAARAARIVELAASGRRVVRTDVGDPRRPSDASTELRALLEAGHRVELVPGVGLPSPGPGQPPLITAREVGPELLAELPLLGVDVIVTRADEQAPELHGALMERGGQPVQLPAIEIGPAADGGAALAAALADVGRYDWVVLTSPNGAERFVAAVGDPRRLAGVRLAAIGPGTAAVLGHVGLVADLVPERYVAESLLDAFPPPPTGGGRVLLARAAVARDVLPDGLRAAGWDVDVVEAYRTVEPPADPIRADTAVDAGDVVTFTSSSTVTGFLRQWGDRPRPAVVACIGPVTAATARDAGLTVDVEATEHTIAGLVDALVAALGPGGPLVGRTAAGRAAAST